MGSVESKELWKLRAGKIQGDTALEATMTLSEMKLTIAPARTAQATKRSWQQG